VISSTTALHVPPAPRGRSIRGIALHTMTTIITSTTAQAPALLTYRPFRQSVPPHDILTILGDSDAAAGPPSDSSRAVDHYSERLRSLFNMHDLTILGTWFRRLDIHRMTWLSHDGYTEKKKITFSLVIETRASSNSVEITVEPKLWLTPTTCSFVPNCASVSKS